MQGVGVEPGAMYDIIYVEPSNTNFQLTAEDHERLRRMADD